MRLMYNNPLQGWLPRILPAKPVKGMQFHLELVGIIRQGLGSRSAGNRTVVAIPDYNNC